VRACLWRAQEWRVPRRLVVGALVVDRDERRARHGGRELSLSRLEFELLSHLAAASTRVFTKWELLRDVWGAWGATVGSAVATGPLVGGLLTDGLGWEWIFFINVPIGIAAVMLTERKLVNITATARQPLDWAGVFTFSTALFLLIFGLIRGNPEVW
jgi:Transcriptional regulatory protein, C terminal